MMMILRFLEWKKYPCFVFRVKHKDKENSMVLEKVNFVPEFAMKLISKRKVTTAALQNPYLKAHSYSKLYD